MKPVQGGRILRVALLSAVTTLILGLSASAAFASITLSEPGPYATPGATIASVTVKAEGKFAEATHVSVAQCNVSPPTNEEATWGERCHKETAIPPTVLIGGKRTFLGFPVVSEFTDWDFTVQPPEELASETTCLNVLEEGEQCAIVASFYKFGGGVVQLGAEKQDILFE
jgi:hypothetical protein